MARKLTPHRRHRGKPLRRSLAAAENFLHGYLNAYGEWALVKGFSEHTVRTQRGHLHRFIAWCDERGISKPSDITRPMMERYQRFLHLYRKADGAPLTVNSQIVALATLRTWFRWMARQNHILSNPAADLELPKESMALPKTILTVAQVEAVINQADVATPIGVRDRAIMETFYSSGIRRMELMNLKLYDVDSERGTVMVRQGKGRRDRLIPLGERACRWVEKYLVEVRSELATTQDERALFLDDFGRPMSDRYLGDLMRRYLEHAGVTTPGACHVFRHAMATHMLENGADIRYIQVMLGHALIETTQIYTRVSMTKLKEIHTATHPARLEARQDTRSARDGAKASPGRPSAAEAFLASLAAEPEADDAGNAGDPR